MYIDLKTCIEADNRGPFRGIIHIGAHHCEELEEYALNGTRNILWVDANPYLNSVERGKISNIRTEYINVALGNVDGENTFLNIASNTASSSVLPLGTHKDRYPDILYVDRVPMKSRRFDCLYEQGILHCDISDYDFINIDVQGVELSVLQGFGRLLEREHFRAIYCEINFEEMYVGCPLVYEIDEFLARFRFQRMLTAAPEGCFGDALYTRQGSPEKSSYETAALRFSSSL